MMNHTDLNDFSSIQLNKNTAVPLYAQLYDELCRMVRAHQLAPGRRLPPVRTLAAHLAINPGTVVSAYRELEQNNYIFTRRGSGSYIAARLPATPDEREEMKAALPLDLIDDVLPTENAQRMINMSSISLDPGMISIDTFKKAINCVLERDGGYAFSYQESQGFYPLRESIAGELAGKKIYTSPRNVQIISGAQQGIDIAARALLQRGDTVFMEKPTYPGAVAAFRACGAKIVDIDLTKEGIDLVELEIKLKQFHPRLIYVMPNIQNPTGISYSHSTCRRLMGLARYYDACVIEDDYISSLHYGKATPIPLKAYDSDDRVIYIRSLSKLFMPGLRLAYMVTPAKLYQQMLNVKNISDIATSGLTQRVFDYYLRTGLWHSHLASVTAACRTRFDFAVKTAKKYLPPDIVWQKPSGGLSLWLELPPRLKIAPLAATAKNRGILLCDGTPFFLRRPAADFIRLSFASLTPAQIQSSLQILSELTREQ